VAVEQTYFEDLVKDESVESPALTVTEAHVSLYRGLVSEAADDPHAVPELLPLCLSTGLGWRVPRPPLAVLAFMGLEWQVLEPLRVGDTIRGRSRPVLRRSMREGGVVVEEHEIVDQRGRVVQRGRFTFLVAKRPSPGGPR
jgi:acyl dehydratase